jgi:hypothetical protein
MAHSTFRKLLQRTRNVNANDRRRPHSPTPFRPHVEGLEERWVLATVHWINPTAGVWADPASWSTGAVPGPNDDVVLDAPGNGTVIHPAGDDTVHSLTGTNSLVLSGGSLRLAAASTFDGPLDLVGGTLATGGMLTVNGPLLWTAGTMLWTGQTFADVTTVANGGLDITGPGPKLLMNGYLDNAQHGTLSGSPLTLQSAGFENLSTGTLEVWGSGVETNDMPLDYHSGFGNRGSVLVSDGTGFGGDFSNDGVVEVSRGGLGLGGYPYEVINTGTIELAGGDLWMSGDYIDDSGIITGAGNVTANSVHDYTNITGPITAAGDMTVSAFGTLLSGPGFSIGGTLSVHALSIGIGNTTVHAGAITLITEDYGAGISNSDISTDSNFSVSVADAFSRFYFSNSTVESPTFTNGRADTYFEGSTLTADSLVNDGLLNFDSASSAAVRDFTNRGALMMAGYISGNLVNTGSLYVGGVDGIGQLTVGGDFTQTATGRLYLNIMDAGRYSQLNVGGTASLDGTLTVSAASTLVEGDSFQAMTFANVVGNFARYDMPNLDAGLFLDAVLGDDGLTLVVRRHQG